MTLVDETQTFFEPRIGKLVHTLSRGIMFAFDHHFGHFRDNWEGLIMEHNSEKVLHNAFSYILPKN